MTDKDILRELDLDIDDLDEYREPAEVPTVQYLRDLTEADLAALELPKSKVPAKALVRIRASHHALARCLAAGMKPGQASLVTGYSASRISILQNDPAFQALVEDYRAEVRSVFANLAERMVDMSLDAMELLQEKLHDHPEEFTVSTLIDVIKTFADRTGYGPNQEVSLKISGDIIDRPPRETYEEWQKRREIEIEGPRKIKVLN